jgi:Histidine kinase-like ATPase domain
MRATSGAPEQGGGPSGGLPELVPGLRWRRVVPGEDRQLAVLRRWLESLLPQCPERDDVAVVANELASNAVRHTASGRGGRLAVDITWYGQVVRVAVTDSGGPSVPQLSEEPAGQHGRGLLLVRGISARTGVCGDQRGRLIWADVPWGGTGATTVAASPPGPHEAAIRDGEAALAHRFAGVPAWFGRSTLQWWAMTGSGGLVTAPSAQELADLLCRVLAVQPLRVSPPGADTQPHAGPPAARTWPWRAPGPGPGPDRFLILEPALAPLRR